MIDDQSTVSGYKERMSRITLFDILYKLQNKKFKDLEDQPVDAFGMGLLSLLFFFENMLGRNKKTGIKELGSYLARMTEDTLHLEADGYQTLARNLVDTFRPSTGKRNRKEFYNYETKQMDFIEYSILKAEGWDRENNIQYYTLDEQGLELVFATKEYFSEFQISISQLMLRKQLEKGEFSSALRQIDEMQISVHTIRDKIIEIKHEIQRNIISEDTFRRYKELIDDIHRRLEREHSEFEELMAFIKETKNQYDQSASHQDKDRKALEMIVRIDRELSHVHNLHGNLLYETLDLKTTTLDAAGESLYNIGIRSFNFDVEITRKIMSTPLPIETCRILSEPFLTLQKAKRWSLLTVFEPQRMEKLDEDENNTGFLGFTKTAEELAVIQRRQKQFLAVFQVLLHVMKGKLEITLSEVVQQIKLLDKEILRSHELYHLWLILHQRSPLSVKEVIENEEHIFYSAFLELPPEVKAIYVQELNHRINIENQFEVKEMRIKLEVNHD